jgi:membrane protein YqaA with SNARE-associated domain
VHKIVVWVQEVAVPFLGLPGIFLASFLDSSFLSLPEINDFLMVTSCAKYPARAPLYILATTFGSLLGCSVLWWLGRRGGEAFLVRRFGEGRVRRTRDAFNRWGILAIAIPSLLPPPMPFKIFVVSAGVFGMPLGRFLLTLLVARGLRYTFWGVLGILYGERALAFLRAAEPWFAENLKWLVLGTVVVGVAAYLVLRARHRAEVPPAV